MFLNKQALKYILLTLSFASSAFEVVKATHDTTFRESFHDSEYNKIVNSELTKMNVNTLYGNTLTILTQYGIISYSSPGYGDAVFVYHTLSLLDDAPFVATPSTCSEQSFGKNGEWTDTICTAYGTAVDICTNEDSSCDAAPLPKITAGKASNFLNNNANAFKFLLCLYSKGGVGVVEKEACKTEYIYYYQEKNYLLDRMRSVPNGLDNVLLSNARGTLSATGNATVDGGFTDPNSHYVIGDGKLSLYEQIFPDNNKADLLVKYVSGPWLLMMNFKKHNNSVQEENKTAALDALIEDALGGHYSQKYAERFFNDKDRRMFPSLASDTFVTECGAAIGIIATVRCGFGPEDIVSFLEYYDSLLTGQYLNDSERYCSLVTSKHYQRAKRYLKTHALDLPYVGGRNPNKRCLNRMKWAEGLGAGRV
jgi:hypothetical protein